MIYGSICIEYELSAILDNSFICHICECFLLTLHYTYDIIHSLTTFFSKEIAVPICVTGLYSKEVLISFMHAVLFALSWCV